jgi:hypothetical protein
MDFDKELLLTKVFAKAGMNRRTIGSKSLLSYSCALMLIIKRQMLSSTNYFQ